MLYKTYIAVRVSPRLVVLVVRMCIIFAVWSYLAEDHVVYLEWRVKISACIIVFCDGGASATTLFLALANLFLTV